MLYLIATPIGNLGDISFRAIEILKSCDYLLCEDTRHSVLLLQKYEIKKPLKSYHKFCEARKETEIMEDLKNGKTIGLITDAGTPGIADPGERLVASCVVHSIPVVPIPGPCALIQALCASGLETSLFQFCGFLPKKSGQLQKAIANILEYPGTSICYESPMRILRVLKEIYSQDSQRQIVIARELTKKFEEFIHGTAEEILNLLDQRVIKGELVLLVQGKVQKKEKRKKYSKEIE
jgi:16S rRNA (cytidine1402-2'-O)-methyltransferase